MAYGQRGMYPPMQGGGFYNPYSAKPQWGAGISQTIQQLMAQKEMQKRQKQQGEQQTFENRMRILNFLKGKDQSERVQALNWLEKNEIIDEKRKNMLVAGLDKIETPEGRIKRIKGETRARKEVEQEFRKEPKPTQFEVKQAEWDARVVAGTATPEERDMVVWGFKPKPTKEEILAKGANPRQANDSWLKDVYKNMDRGAIEKSSKEAKARPIVMGISIDMPYAYNLATLNRNDGIATPKDTDTIQKYDGMFRYFNDVLLKGKALSFKEFMKLPEARDPDFDKMQIKKWYEYYEGILYEKGFY